MGGKTRSTFVNYVKTKFFDLYNKVCAKLSGKKAPQKEKKEKGPNESQQPEKQADVLRILPVVELEFPETKKPSQLETYDEAASNQTIPTHRDDPLHGLDLIGLTNKSIVKNEIFDTFDNCLENQGSLFEVQNNSDSSFEILETSS